MSVIYLIMFCSVSTQLELYSIPNGDKFLVDWSTPLISEVYDKDQSEPCNDGDDPVIYFPWFGAQHMCVDDEAMVATRGFTCERGDLLYKTVGSKQRKTTIRTNFNDVPGFPMVQMSVFEGRKYCGKKIYTENATGHSVQLTFRNIQFQDNGWCNGGGKRCGNNFCVPSGEQCPLTDFQIFGASNIGAGYEKSVPLGKDNKFVLAFKSDQDNYPATMVQFALTQPCYAFFFSSGPQTFDNSIYQFQDFEYMFKDMAPRQQVIVNGELTYDSQWDVTEYTLQRQAGAQYLINTLPDEEGRTNKCPKSRTNDLFVEQSYSRADKSFNLPFNLHDIYAQNGVDKVLKNQQMFSQGAYDATKSQEPGLWYRSAYFFDKDCETSDRLSRENLLQVLRENIERLFQDARDSVKAGIPWAIVRLVFFFVGAFATVGITEGLNIPPQISVGVWAIILTVLHFFNTYHLSQVRSDIWAVIDGIAQKQVQINQCVSQDQKLDAEFLEKDIMDQVYSYTNGANTVNTILMLWNLSPILVLFGIKFMHHLQNHHLNVDRDDRYQDGHDENDEYTQISK